MAKVRPEFFVDLKGKSYPVYAGVLIAAHEEGLLGISVKILQYPSEANGWSAVCQATVTMRGDGEREQVFEDLGDCSPKNASPQIALASIRMASTRAKGRALRDAIALGATLFEELPAWETEKEVNGDAAARPAARVPRSAAANGPMVAAPSSAARSTPNAEVGSCEVCHGAVSKNEQTASQHHFKRDLCRTHFAGLRQQAETHNEPSTA